MTDSGRRRTRVRVTRTVPLRGRVAFPVPSPEVVSVYDRALRRAQLRTSVGTLALVVLPLLSLPLLGVLVPGLAAVEVLGMSVSWLLLAVLFYPAVLAAARRHVSAAERIEVDFQDLVGTAPAQPGRS